MTPILSRRPEVVKIHLVCISSRFYIWLDLLPSTPSWTWHHPVGRLHSVCLLSRLWLKSTTSLSTSIWPWCHPVTLQPLKVYLAIITCQNLSRSFFFCRFLIIFLENIFSVSTSSSSVSFLVGVHPYYPFFLLLCSRLHLTPCKLAGFVIHHEDISDGDSFRDVVW